MAIKALPRKGKAKAPVKVPSKRTMNFVHHKSSFNPRRMLPLILAIVICTGAFLKFGFLDQTQKKVMAYQELAGKQDQLASLNALLADYDSVAREYGRYSYGWMEEKEISMVNRIDILTLVESKIAPRAVIENIAVNDNVLTLNIHGLTLEQASSMVKIIENSDLVESASVYNAVAENAENASIFMSIILTKEAE